MVSRMRVLQQRQVYPVTLYSVTRMGFRKFDSNALLCTTNVFVRIHFMRKVFHLPHRFLPHKVQSASPLGTYVPGLAVCSGALLQTGKSRGSTAKSRDKHGRQQCSNFSLHEVQPFSSLQGLWAGQRRIVLVTLFDVGPSKKHGQGVPGEGVKDLARARKRQ